MKKLFLALFAVLAQAGASAAVVVNNPSITITAGDGSVRTLVAGDGSVRVATRGDVQTWTLINAFELSGANFYALEFTFDPDPFIAFSAAVSKSTTPSSTFSFAFYSPYVGGPYDQVSSLLDATLQARDSALMTAITHTTIVDAVNVLSTTMPDCSSSSSALQACTTTAGAASIAATGANGFFGSSFSFTLDAPGVATFVGRSDLLASTSVPAPATLPLALVALSGLGWTLHRRRAAAARAVQLGRPACPGRSCRQPRSR